MRIAFVDPLGLPYDGSTLEKRGLGGSESAVIHMARELAKIGFEVTVFNNCNVDDCKEGTFDGVKYYPLNYTQSVDEYDVLVCSRSVKPFVENWNVVKYSNHKVLWMHDTFCDGDNDIQDLVVGGFIDEIFTLSDWHTSYVTTCNHGKARVFEVLKDKIFQTRNGINAVPEKWVDISKKDPNLFVYNASVTKGLKPLVNEIWPWLKNYIPDAKLKVIGGYYRFSDEHGPDQQELDLKKMSSQNHEDIEFTGIINQKQISKILTDASYMIYPSEFPETFGISTLEALAHNVPIITCNNGALEETAIDIASYKINYPISPNWMLPDLDSAAQQMRFVDTVKNAYNTPYLHQQKMYACNQVKDICTWETVALQWKQHLYHKLGKYLPVEEYRKVQKINHNVAKVFGRRFSNPEAVTIPKNKERLITVIIPAYNARNYIERCLESVISQDYDNWEVSITDDASTDDTYEVINNFIKRHPELSDKFFVNRSAQNRGAVYNQMMMMNHLPDTINILLDGDDWLVNNPNIFNMYNNLYHDGAQFTYGSCLSLADNIPLIAQEYPPEVKQNRDYRNYRFNWNIPYTHLRTFSSNLIDFIDKDDLLDDEGNWYKAGGDVALFYALIEAAYPDAVIAVPDVVCVYNDTNPINDYKVNSEEQTKTANQILEKNKLEPTKYMEKYECEFVEPSNKTILVGVPTNKYIEPETFKSIFDMRVPEGFKVEFQYFYGYQIDQIRNLMAMHAKKYDYIFFVDSDITFPKDTLEKMINANVDIVSGVYRQRLNNRDIEIYDTNYEKIPYETIKTHVENHHNETDAVEIGACGFGCVLINSNVIRSLEYPQFVYEMADVENIGLSEDVYFCKKAREAGFKVWTIPHIQCGHYGAKNYSLRDLD